MSATISGKEVVVKLNSRMPKAPGEDPLYREAHLFAVLQGRAEHILPAQTAGMGLHAVRVRPGRVVSMLVMERVAGDSNDLLTRLHTEQGPI